MFGKPLSVDHHSRYRQFAIVMLFPAPTEDVMPLAAAVFIPVAFAQSIIYVAVGRASDIAYDGFDNCFAKYNAAQDEF
jgi:hypothetical protein